MKAPILARVSTEEQKQAGNSLPAQQVRLVEYINGNRGYSKTDNSKLILDKEFIFDESAYKEHRKEFDKVLNYLSETKGVLALCCDKVDRLSRDFLVGLPALEKLRREGKIELHFPSDNLVLHQNSPATDLFHFNIAVSLAQYYSNAISDNTKRALENKRRKGEWNSKAPLGYLNVTLENEETTIIIDHSRRHLIIKIFELYASGLHSIQSVAEAVYKEGLRSKDGHRISNSEVDRILLNPFYYGQPYSKKHGLYPAYHNYGNIIDKILFDKCQEVRNQKRKGVWKAKSQEFIFKGLLTCADCGCRITPEKKIKKSGLVFIYYSCTNGKKICKRYFTSEQALLAPILAKLKGLSKISIETQERLVEELRKSSESEVAYHKAQIERIRKEMDRLALTKKNLLDKFISPDNKSITMDMYDKKLQEISDKELLYNTEMEEHLKADTDYKTTIGIVFSLARRASEIFESSEPEEKRQLLSYLIQNPTVKQKTLMFTMRNPFNLILDLQHQPTWGDQWESNP